MTLEEFDRLMRQVAILRGRQEHFARETKILMERTYERAGIEWHDRPGCGLPCWTADGGKTWHESARKALEARP